jgi:DNA repair exonuclease SbcCD ATPase subunit
MANEEVVFNVKSNIKSVTKETEDLNNVLEEQKDILVDLQREEIQLQQKRTGMSDYEASISGVDKRLKLLKGSIKEQKFEVQQLTKEQKKNTQELKENEKAVKDGIGSFQVFGVSLNGIQNSIKKIIPTIKLMFKSIYTGILSTGIGAFLIAFGSLATYFTSTKRGADQLKVAFTAIGATVDVLKDRLSKVGEAISLVFSGKFAEAGDLLKESVTGIVAEVKEEIKVMTALEKRVQALRDAEMDFAVQKAKTRQEIEKARLVAEDETKSAEERLTNLKKALELEEQTTNRELELAREKVAIQEEQMAVSENLVEDEKLLTDLRVELISKETASVKMRRRVVTEVNALEREIAAEKKQRAKEREDAIKKEQEELKKLIDLQLQQLMAFEDQKTKMQNQISLLEITNEQEKQDKILAIQQQAENTAINNLKISDAEKFELRKQLNAKYDILRKQNVENDKKANKENTMNTLSAVSGLSSALGGLAGENKALSAGSAIIDTYVGANKALAQGGALGFISAAAVIATGLANVKKIFSTDVGTGGGGSTPSLSDATPAPKMLSGKFELAPPIEQQPVQAYVVTDNLTDNQNKLAYIRRRATI